MRAHSYPSGLEVSPKLRADRPRAGATPRSSSRVSTVLSAKSQAKAILSEAPHPSINLRFQRVALAAK